MALYLGAVFLCIALPLGVLLPVWFESEPDSTGEVVLLVFMMAPTAVALIVFNVFTFTTMPHLPFKIPDYVFADQSTGLSDGIFAALSVCVPTVVSVPLVLTSELGDTGKYTFYGLGGFILLLLLVSVHAPAPAATLLRLSVFCGPVLACGA